MTNYLMILVISFYLYCFFGWVWESFVLPLSRKQLPYNRGFLYGPWIPIYGFGAILVIVLFDIRHVNYPFYVLVLGGGVVSCLLEYITSFIMEELFHRRWWDYSQKAFNAVVVNYIQPFFVKQLMVINKDVLLIIGIVLGGCFIVDTIITTRTALKIDKKLELVKQILDEKEEKIIAGLEKRQAKLFKKLEQHGLEWQKQQLLLRKLLEEEKLFRYRYRRLIRAFPHIIKKKRRDD